MTELKQRKCILIFLWISIGILGRLIPHIPNVTPLTSLSLLASALFTRRMAFFLVSTIVILSDVLLAYLQNHAFFGSWTIFTYTGFLAVFWLGTYLDIHMKLFKAIFLASIASFLFWIWTNFGTWLISGMYLHSMLGLITCFIAGLPFLRNTLIGSIVWMLVLLGGVRILHSFAYGMRIYFASSKFQLMESRSITSNK